MNTSVKPSPQIKIMNKTTLPKVFLFNPFLPPYPASLISRQPLIFLSLYFSLHFLDFYKNVIKEFVHFFIWLFSQDNYFEIHLSFCMNQKLVHFYG